MILDGTLPFMSGPCTAIVCSASSGRRGTASRVPSHAARRSVSRSAALRRVAAAWIPSSRAISASHCCVKTTAEAAVLTNRIETQQE